MIYKRLFRNWNFIKLWGAQIASQLAANLLNFALIIRVFDLAAGKSYQNIAVSLLITAFGVPSIFFAIFAGTVIDHLDRKKVLVLTNIIRAVLVLAFLVVDTNLLFVYLLIFAISVFTQFFVPAEAAALPALVEERQLVQANSLFVFTLYGSFILGYSMAGPVVAALGHNGAYWVTAAAFAFAGLLSIGLPALRASDRRRPALGPLISETAQKVGESLREIVHKRQYFFPILQLTVAQAMVGVLIVLAPGLSEYILHTSLQNASWILIVPAGLGMIAGAVLAGQFIRDRDKVRIIRISITIAGLGLLGLGGIHSLPVHTLVAPLTAVLVLILGVMNALVSISAQTLLQIHTVDEIRGKVFGALNMMVNIAAVLPVLLAGATADLVTPATVIAIAGGLILLYGLMLRPKSEQLLAAKS